MDGKIPMGVSAAVSCALVALALVAARRIGAPAFDAYRERGGGKGFWAWFARDACGLPVPGIDRAEDEEPEPRRAAEGAAAAARGERMRAAAKKAAVERAREAAREETLARKLEAARKAKRDEAKAAVQNAAAAAAGKRAPSASGRSGGSVKTGGKSSFTGGDGKRPYRVVGIQGLEFGSSDNAPPEGAKPIMSVAYDADGNAEFHSLKWRELRALSEPVYGFDKAYLNHTYGTEQLSSVVLTKSFPFTEEGFRQAAEFYRTMAGEASADLGFEPVHKDRMDQLNRATLCEFTNRDGDTSIRGSVSAYSDKALTVQLSVADRAYSRELADQARAAYESGVADAVDARIEVVNRDHADEKRRINEFLGNE